MIDAFKQSKFWLCASILLAILFGLAGFKLAIGEYTIQDDARQHVFWLQRLVDPSLFPNDLIADYFSSVAPAGYKFIYWLANFCGLAPLTFNKILPVLLGVGTSIYLFLVTTTIFPVAIAGFFACLLLNQNLWLLDDLVSGTPRAFLYVLFLGFIYHLLQAELLSCLLFIILQGLFYPQTVLISAGILSLNLIIQKQNKKLYLVGLIAAVLVVAVYKLQTAEFSEVITLARARQLPEFAPAGRSAFFSDRPWHFWLVAKQSGWLPFEWQYFALCGFGLLLPLITKFPRQFPLVKQLNNRSGIIGQILLTSFGWYCLSHLLLFRLHLPSRYSQHTWRMAIALLAGITITILLYQLIIKIALNSSLKQGIILTIATLLLLYPTYAVQAYPYRLGYVTAPSPKLYQFLQQQPPEIVIATLSSEADFIPSFAQRSVLTAREYSIPYHWDYYGQIRQRTKDLIQAQYSLNLKTVRQFGDRYDVDFWLLDRSAFTPEYLTQNDWLRQFSTVIKPAIDNLETGQPAIMQQSDRCSVYRTASLNLLDTKCLVSASRE